MTFGCVRVTSGAPNYFYPDQECGAPGFYVLAVFSFLVCVLFFVGMNIVGLTCYDPAIPVTLNKRIPVTSQVTGSHTTFYVWSIFMLSVVHALSHSAGWRWPMSIVLTAAGCMLSYIEFATIPRAADDAQILSSLQALGIAWAGICAFITTALNADADRGQATAMLLYVGFPLLAVITVMCHRARYNALALCRERDLQSPASVLLYVRTLLWHWIGEVHVNGFDSYVETTDGVRERRDEVFRAVKAALELGIERFPHSALLRTYLARFYSEIVDNRVLAYGELQASEPYVSGITIKFAQQRLRMRLDTVTTDTQTKEVRAYLEFKTRKEDADAAMVGASRLLVDFWTQLLTDAPDIDIMSRLSHDARRLIARSAANYDRLLEINPSSVPVLRTYGTIVLDILGDAPRALDMFERAELLEITRAKAMEDKMDNGEFLQRLTTNLDIFDDRNAVFGITVEKEAFGLIETINPAAKKLFGYFQNSDLVGKNINVIIPPPLAGVHDTLMSDYLIRKTSRIVNQTRVTYGLHRFGYLMPLNLYVRWADEAAGKMVGVIQTIEQPRDVHFLVDPADWTVRYATKNALDFFGIRRAQLADGGVLLPELLTDLQRRNVTAGAGEDAELLAEQAAAEYAGSWRQLGTHTGLIGRGRHYDTQRDFPVRSWSQTMSVAGAEVAFVRVLVYEYTGEGDAEEEDEEAFLTHYKRAGAHGHDDDEDVAAPTLLAGLVDDDDNRGEGLAGRVAPPCIGSIPPANSLRLLGSASAAGSMRRLLKPSASQHILDVGGAETPSAAAIVTSTQALPPTVLGASGSMRALLRLQQAQRSAKQLDLSLSRSGSAASVPLLGSAAAGPSSSSTPDPVLSPETETETVQEAVQKRRDAAAARTRAAALGPGRAGSKADAPLPGPGRTSMRSIVVAVADDTRSRGSVATSTNNTASSFGFNDKKTLSFGQKRLLQAIELENLHTTTGIARMSRLVHALVYGIIACAVVSFVVTTRFLDQASADASAVLKSSNRNTSLMDAILCYRSLSLINSRNFQALFEIPFTFPVIVFPMVLSMTSQRVDSTLSVLVQAGNELNSIPSVNHVQDVLRNSATTSVLIRLGDTYTRELTSLKEGYLRLTAYIASSKGQLVSLKNLSPTSVVDISFFMGFYILANGLEALRVANDESTLLKRESMAANHKNLLLANCLIFGAAVLGMLIIIFCFIRPIVLRVEESKSHVLDMFLDIKRPVRRALRRQVYSVYITMKSDGEEDKHNVEEEPADHAEGAADDLCDNDAAATSGLASAASGSSKAPKDTDAGNDGVARAQGGTAHSRYLMRIARKRAARRHAAAAAHDDSSGDDASLDLSKPESHARSRERVARSAIDAFLGSLDAAETASADSDKTSAPNSGDAAPGTPATGGKSYGAATIDNDPYTKQLRQLSMTDVEGGTVTVNLGSLTNATKAALVRSETQEKLALVSPVERAKQAAAAADAALESVVKASSQSLLARRALRSLVLRLSLFAAVVIGYAIMMCVLTQQSMNFVEQYSVTLDTATRRGPMLQRALFNMRENLFGRYEDVIAAQPLAPTAMGGDFVTTGRGFLNETLRLHHAVMFGNETMDLGAPASFEEQDKLMFTSACDLPANDRAWNYSVGALPDFYNAQCKTIANGALDKGLHQGLLYAWNELDALIIPANSGVFGMWQNLPANVAIPEGSPEFQAIFNRFRAMQTFISYFLAVGFWRSSALYLVQVFEMIESFNTTRLILIMCFSVLVYVLYFFGIRSVGHELDVAARQTRAMMLILPPYVAKSLPSVQTFILSNHRKRT
jgi:PAS domain S-box-containing protein